MAPIPELLQKLSDHTITPEEKQYLFSWLRSHQEEWALSLYDEYRHLLGQNAPVVPAATSARILDEVHRKIGLADSTQEPKPTLSLRTRLWAAACVALLLLAGVGWLVRSRVPSPQVAPQTKVTGRFYEKYNPGPRQLAVALPDGSSVWLYAGSRLRYPEKFGPGERRVSLRGKAFFEVSRNTEKPFLVYSDEMVTRVLGTSFTIEAFENQPTFSVSVKTGVVTVGRQTDSERHQAAVSLRATERVVLKRASAEFVPSTGALPEPGDFPVRTPETYRFLDKPVTAIFAALERDYGIPIQFDEQKLATCSLTTTLEDKPFFEKLKIICEGIGPGTRFSFENEKVTIHSLGCNN